MTNSTLPLHLLVPFGCYAGSGLVISLSNWLIVACVLRYAALRHEKEFVLLMALALADALNMANYIFASGYRTWALFAGRLFSRLTPIECVLKPHLFNWIFLNHLSTLMLVVVSADRLYAVVSPVAYLQLTHRYAHKVVLSAYGFVFCMGCMGLGFIFTTEQVPDQPAMCMGIPSLFGAGSEGSTLRNLYAVYYIEGPTLFAFLSVIIYIFIYPTYKSQKSKVAPRGGVDNDSKAQLNRQRQLTKSLAVSCLCTFWLYCVPFRLGHVLKGVGLMNISQVFWILSSFNSFANLIIYQWKIPEIRTAIRYMIHGKDLPGNIRLWPKKATTTTSARPSIKRSSHHTNHA